MQQSVAHLHDHVVICGWAGSAVDRRRGGGRRPTVVVVDRDPGAAVDVEHAVTGDATDDDVLRAAGIERASALVAAVGADASNSFITLSARALAPDLFIVARVSTLDSEAKLQRAGADRVISPERIGGARMAAFVLRPSVASLMDVVMQERNLELRLEEVRVAPGSPVAGRSLREAEIRERTGAMLLAVETEDGSFGTGLRPDTVLEAGQVVSPSAPRRTWPS